MPLLAILLYALTVTQQPDQLPLLAPPNIRGAHPRPYIVGSVPSTTTLPECGDQPCNVCGYDAQCSWKCAEGYLDVDESGRLVCKE